MTLFVFNRYRGQTRAGAEASIRIRKKMFFKLSIWLSVCLSVCMSFYPSLFLPLSLCLSCNLDKEINFETLFCGN